MIDLFCQDINFSQSLHFKEFINPSLLVFNDCQTLFINDRQIAIQYGGINTFRIGYKNFYPKKNSGLSIFLNNELHKKINALNTEISYVYRVNLSSNFKIVPGLIFVYAQRTYDFQNMIFPSMLGTFGVEEQINPISLPIRDNISIGLDFSLAFLIRHFYIAFRGNNIVNYYLANGSMDKKKVYSFIMGYGSYLKGERKNSLIFIIKKLERDLEVSYSFNWFVSKTFSFTTSINLWNFQAGLLSLTCIYKSRRVSWLFSYGISVGKVGFSIYEMGLIYEINCKNQRKNTIKCPAYQF